MRKVTYALGSTVASVLVVAATAVAGGGITIEKKGSTATTTQATLKAKCSASDHVLAGGFRLPDGDNIAQQDEPAGEGAWKVESYLDDLGLPAHVDTFALCERASARKLKIVSKSVTVPAGTGAPKAVAKAFGQATVKAQCPEGWQVVSGGYAVVPPYTGGSDGEVAVDTNKRAGSTAWKVHGANEGDKTDLKAFAVCEKQSQGKIQQIAKKVPITQDMKGVLGVGVPAVAKCPRGSHLVGGGFQSRPTQNQNPTAFPEVSASMPSSKKTWTAHYNPHASGSITSYVECEKG
jgi:hypothetical protein